MENSGLNKIIVAGVVIFVLVPVVINGVSAITRLGIEGIDRIMTKVNFNKAMKDGIRKGTIRKVGKNYYVVVPEEA